MITEKQLQIHLSANWKQRVGQMKYKKGTKKYEDAMLSYIQGAFVTAVFAKVITVERYEFISFMCTIGRANELLEVIE